MRTSIYDPESVRPMWEQLEQVGVKSITTANEINEFITRKDGITMVVINSICGCAAGSARPGIMKALQHKTIPNHLCTVFAGQDHEAVDKVRSLMPVPPSSPCVGLFESGKMIFALQRHELERATTDQVAQKLIEAFDRFCSAEGPSVAPEVYQGVTPVTKCGTNIPRYAGKV